MKGIHNNIVRVGVAGMGGIAKRTHLPVLRRVPGFQVICGAEKDEYQRERVGKLFGIPETYEDFDEMIQKADIDAVYVCLPASLHAKAVVAALKRGRHVFCEKPMGLNSEEAKTMVELAANSRLILMPGFNLRHVRNFIEAKKIIDSGKLGKIIHVNAVFMNPGPYISWDPKSDWYLDGRSGGALYDIGSHIVDLLLHLFPFRMKELSARATQGYRPYDALTNIVCSFRGDDGLLGTIQIGWRTACEVCSIEFHGTAGSLAVSRRMLSYTHGATDPADRVFNSLANVCREIGAVVKKVNLMRKGLDVLMEFQAQAIDFARNVRKGQCEQAIGEKVCYVHTLLEAMEASIRTESPVYPEMIDTMVADRR